MTRFAGVEIRFSNNLSDQKKAWDEYVSYVQSHQPTVNGVPIGAGATAGMATARTFGGQETVAGPMMAQRGSPSIPDSDGGHLGGGVSAAIDRDERRRQAQYARVDRNWDLANFARFRQEERAASRLAQVTQLTASDLVGEPSAGDRAEAAGMLGGGGAGGGRAGLRRFLGGEGFRTLGRYIGAYAITAQATSYLNQQNQYGIALGGATTYQDAIAAGLSYQANSPLAQLPVVGGLGSAIRESFTGEQRGLASTQAGIGIDRDIYGIRQGVISSGYAARSAAFSAQGDFEGQRQAIRESTAGGIQGLTATSTQRTTDLSNNIQALLDASPHTSATLDALPRIGPGMASAAIARAAFARDYHLASDAVPNPSKEDQSKIDGMKAEIATINASTATLTAQQQSRAADLTAAVNRSERSFLVGSASNVRAANLDFSDEREAARERIRGPYEARIAGTIGVSEANAARSERDAALRNEDQGFQIRNQSDEISLKADRQVIGGNPFAAANLRTYAQYGDRNFGLISRNPQRAGILEAQRDTSYQANAVDDIQRRFGIEMGTQRIEQATTQQNYRNKFLFRTGDVSGAISSGVDAIQEARMTFPGSADAGKLANRIAAIEANTKSNVYGITHPLDYGNRVEQVGQYVMHGDLGNRNYADLREARRLSGTTGQALSDAETGKVRGGDSVTKSDLKDLGTLLQNIVDAINNN